MGKCKDEEEKPVFQVHKVPSGPWQQAPSILQKRKLRPREVKGLIKITQLVT